MQTLSARLVSQNVASVRDVEKALGRQLLYGGDLATNLLELGMVKEPELTRLLAETHSLRPGPSGELPRATNSVLRLVPGETSLRHDFYPLDQREGCLEVAVCEPLETPIRQELETSLGLTLVEYAVPMVRIRQAIARDYRLSVDRRTERVIAKLSGQPDPHPSGAPEKGSDNERRPLWSPSLPEIMTPDFDELVPSTHARPPPAKTPVPPFAALAPGKRVIVDADATGEPRVRLESDPPSERPRFVPAERAPGAVDANSRAPWVAFRSRWWGPLAAAVAEHAMFAAQTRDQVLSVFFAFVSQYFDYSALFAIHGDLAEGRDARGPGASRERLNSIGVPLDLPSALARARDAHEPLIEYLADQGLDGSLVRDLARGFGHKVLLLPVSVRGRSVLVLYGDHGEEDVDAASIGAVFTFAELASKALEFTILRRKQTPGHSFPPPPAARETEPEGERPVSPKTLLSGTNEPVSGAPLAPANRAPVKLDEPPEEGWELEPRTRPGLGKEALEFLRAESKPPIRRESMGPASVRLIDPDASRKLVPSVRSPEPGIVRTSPPATETPSQRQLQTPSEAEPPRRDTRLSGSNQEPGQSSGGEESPAQGRSEQASTDLKAECENLVQRLLQGEPGTAVHLFELGAPAAEALARVLPGPVQKEWVTGGARPMRASECGPVLHLLSRFGNAAVSPVAARSRDNDPTVRIWATRLLGELPGPEGAKAIVERLVDDDPSVRHAAMETSVGLRTDTIISAPELTEQLRAFAADGTKSEDARRAAVESLGKLRDPLAVESLVPLLEIGSQQLKDAAYAALKVLTRQDFGQSSPAWRGWWQDHRARHRIEWLIDSITHADPAIRRDAGEELKNLTKEYFGYYDDLPEKERLRAQERYREWWKDRGKARFTR